MTGVNNNTHHTRFTNNDNNNSPTKNNYTSPTKLIKSPANTNCSTCNTTNPTFSKSQLKKKIDRKCVQCIEKLNSNTPPTSSKKSDKKSEVNVNMNGAPNVNQPSVQRNDNDNTTSSPQSTAKKEKKRKKRKRSKKDTSSDKTTNNEQQHAASTTTTTADEQKDYEECKATGKSTLVVSFYLVNSCVFNMKCLRYECFILAFM